MTTETNEERTVNPANRRTRTQSQPHTVSETELGAGIRRISYSLLALSLLLTTSSACDKGDAGSATPAEGAAAATGDAPPPLSGTTSAGDQLSLDGLVGKVVLVDFWASWCLPCKDELPELEKLYAEFADQGLVIVGVSVDEEVGDMEAFLGTMPLSFPVIFDEGKTIAGKWDPPKMPTSYFIGRDGKLDYVHAGYEASQLGDIRSRIETLLAAGN